MTPAEMDSLNRRRERMIAEEWNALPLYAYARLAEACDECGAEVAREDHDAACISGWIDDMPSDYTDDSTDTGERYNG